MIAETLQQQSNEQHSRSIAALLRALLQWVIRPHPSITDDLAMRRSQLLAGMTAAISGVGILIWTNRFLRSPELLAQAFTWVVFAGIVIIFTCYLINRTGRVNFAATLLVGAMYCVFVTVPFMPASNVTLFSYSVVTILLTGVFFSLKAAFRTALLIVLTIVILGVVTKSDAVQPVVNFLLLSTSVIYVFIKHLQFEEGLRAKELHTVNERLRIVNERLRASEESLEQRVQERTRDLQVAADVSLQITTVLDRAALLADVAERTANAFDLYHVSIFLYDEAHATINLQQGVGDAGRRMTEAGKQFQLDDIGLVPQAARAMQATLANDTASDPNHLVNPLLPDTRAELAIPMIYRGKLIGVLDLQSQTAGRFHDEDIRILRTLADQIAIAVRNSQLFEEANTARSQAERANAVKSTFLSSMSHELRTPMNAIINFTKFVAKGSMGPVNEQQQATLGEVIDSAKHLLNLINDVLDMSKIEAGALQLFIEDTVDFNTILRVVHMTGKSLLGEKPVELVTDLEDFPMITGDKQRILQILLNIMSNACKFTDAGRITLRAYREGGMVVTAISDTGPGIAPDDQHLVFQAFKQTETGLRQAGGTGLGMPISRSLAEAHGGRLWLESAPGQGTTFFVALPASAAPEPSFA